MLTKGQTNLLHYAMAERCMTKNALIVSGCSTSVSRIVQGEGCRIENLKAVAKGLGIEVLLRKCGSKKSQPLTGESIARALQTHILSRKRLIELSGLSKHSVAMLFNGAAERVTTTTLGRMLRVAGYEVVLHYRSK